VQTLYITVTVIVNGEEDDVTYFELQPTGKQKKKNFDISDSYSRDKSGGAMHRMKRSVIHLSLPVVTVMQVFCACQHLPADSTASSLSFRQVT
jgi:hypothetical protein